MHADTKTRPMSTRASRRPWLAAFLAILQPGLGHVYLREWVRSVVWFGMWAATVLLIAPAPDAGLAEGVVAYVLATLAALEEVSLGSRLALLSVSVFSMIDAYWIAARENRGTDETRCPHCGKAVDESLEFCHWCTEPIAADVTGDEADRRTGG